jgi:hypothetical protein
MGRAPEIWLDPQGPADAYVELLDLEISEDATTGPRVQVPAPGRQCVKWLKSGEKCDALVEIAEPGLVRVFPWEPYGAEILNRIKELRSESDGPGVTEILFLTERFRRIHVEKGGRLPVHEREQFHLGLSPVAGWLVLLVCLPTHVELWNEDFRRRWRARTRFDLPWTKPIQT